MTSANVKRHMYNDSWGQSIFIVTDADFLAQPCRETLPNITTDKIVSQLLDTARRLDSRKGEMGCLGLAANQLGFNERIFVIKIKGKFKPFINPETIEGMGTQDSFETCFSRPGQPPQKAKRKVYVKVRGASKILGLHGMSAIAFQHELDHLNGVLI